MPDIYLLIDGKQEGPYTEEQVKRSLEQGRIPGDLPAWQEGLTDWVQVEGLIDLARQTSAALIGEPEALVEVVHPDVQKYPEGNQPPIKSLTTLLPLIDRWRTNRKLTLVATADHVELSATHLVLGLKIDWTNRTSEPITIKEIQVGMHLSKRPEDILRFFPLERFRRSHTGKGYQTTPLCTITLHSQKTHVEQLRFIAQQILDIPEGNYAADITMKDINDTTYTFGTNLQIVDEIKYRRSDDT